ncbi:MAG: thioredoxin family protein [Spirochaetota bacterium]
MDVEQFNRGYDIETYVENLRNYRSFVKRLMGEAKADSTHVSQLKQAIADHPQPVRATMTTEDWCGDSACNGPILSDLFNRAGIDFRVFRGSEETELKDMYESQGADHIPVVSIWDGSGNELARWIEAPQAVSEKKSAWKQEHPEFEELYKKQKTDKEAAKQFASLYRTFIEEMGAWYKSGMWSETTSEIVELVKQGSPHEGTPQT